MLLVKWYSARFCGWGERVSPEEIKQLIEAGMATECVEVSGDGRHFDILVVSAEFDGLSPVKKQQLVYSHLNDKIADGSLHAINMRTLTPSEYSQ